MRATKPSFEINKNQNATKKIALVYALWNKEYNLEMLESAKAELIEQGISESNISSFKVPGAFEIPLLAQKLADKQEFDAIIVFATVIKGATIHFELVATEATRGIMSVALECEIPIINGILACNTEEQAKERASRTQEDKGKELALSCLELCNELALV
jgi:6,7-dimethyl-8-ribityllumazine synthase